MIADSISEMAAAHVVQTLSQKWASTSHFRIELQLSGLRFRDAHNDRGLLVCLDTLCAVKIAERRQTVGRGHGWEWRAHA